MIDKRNPITVGEAIHKVMNLAKKGEIEHVPIEESYGRFLGENLVADHHVPPFDKSLYDGFAIRSIDTNKASTAAQVELEVIGEIGAGSVFRGVVRHMQAVRIMTGAQIPRGCDAVIMLESVKEITTNYKKKIQIKDHMNKGENISFTGEDTKKGTVLVNQGTYINPGIVACLATFGYKKVPVSKKPIIGVIATGSELLDLDEPMQQGKIRNSNAYMIGAQIKRAGGQSIYFGQFSDDVDICYQQINDSLDQVDYLITTGGVSVGDFDYLPHIYKKLGANVLFNKVAMRPGSVTTVAEMNGKLLFGLSGNPSACYVGFEMFVRPVIRSFINAQYSFLQQTKAKLSIDFPRVTTFNRFVRGNLTYNHGDLVATPIGLDNSSVVTSLTEANILIVFPPGAKGYKRGKHIPIILLEDQEGTTLKEYPSI